MPPAHAGKPATGPRRALEAKIVKNAHRVGNLVEALRLRSLSCEPTAEGDGAPGLLQGVKMPRRRLSRPDAPPEWPPAAVASRSPVLKACSLGCRSLVHGGPEADASLKRLTVRGVVQFEAAMVEELAACCQRHKAPSLLALHTVSCYPTRLISPAAQRRAMLLRPRSRWSSGWRVGRWQSED